LRAFPGFQVFVGTERFLLANLREGGAGTITASANVNAGSLVRAFRERTEERQREIDVLRGIFESFPLIAALKETIARRTGDVSWRVLRPPLVELSEDERARLQQALKAAGSP